MLKISRSRHYFVPVVESTCEILELLVCSDQALKSRQIADRTRVAPTTTYRILRTLVHRGYVVHDLNGGYALAARQAKSLLPDVVRSKSKPGLRGAKSSKALTTADIVAMLSAILEFLQD